MFLGFFSGALLLNFDKIFECELLIMSFPKLAYMFNVAGKNLSASLNVLGLVEIDVRNDVSAGLFKNGTT
jgi:hypothetical protein